jgi:hypothetical protein
MLDVSGCRQHIPNLLDRQYRGQLPDLFDFDDILHHRGVGRHQVEEGLECGGMQVHGCGLKLLHAQLVQQKLLDLPARHNQRGLVVKLREFYQGMPVVLNRPGSKVAQTQPFEKQLPFQTHTNLL